MSKSLLIDYSSFDITPQMIVESEKNNNGRVIVSGVLQRANAKNQNGRVYPKETLMREAKKILFCPNCRKQSTWRIRSSRIISCKFTECFS